MGEIEKTVNDWMEETNSNKNHFMLYPLTNSEHSLL